MKLLKFLTKTQITIFVLFILNSTSFCQDFGWVKTSGTAEVESASALFVDQSDFIYSVGKYNGTVDLDPGPGEYFLEDDSVGYASFIQKLDSDGEFVWARGILNSGIGIGADIGVDSSGNVYVVGTFNSWVDFDPGVGEEVLYPLDLRDGFILKLDSDGNFVWVKTFASTGNVQATEIIIDPFGNLIIGGYFSSEADFDPGDGTFYMTPSGSSEFFIVKLDSSGDFIWANASSGTGTTDVRDLETDSEGNIYAVGPFNETVDFDPGPGVYNLNANPGGAGTSSGGFILSYFSDGTFNWAKEIVAPSISNYAWASAIAIDETDNIYVAGYFAGTVDLDPGPGLSEFTSETYKDFYTLKLNEAGDFQWVSIIECTGFWMKITELAAAKNQICTYVQFTISANFDPIGGTTTRDAVSRDNGIQIVDSLGNFVWAESFGGELIDYGAGVAINSEDAIIANGAHRSTTDFDLGPDTYELTAEGTNPDFFVLKLLPEEAECLHGTDTVFACDSYTWIDGITYEESNSVAEYANPDCDSILYLDLTVAYSDSVWFEWETCDSLLWIDGVTYYESNNTATYTLTNAAGCDSVIQLNLSINKDTSSFIWEACNSYTWIDGITYTESNNTATHILTNEYGCDSIITLDLTINHSDSTDFILETCESFTWIDGVTYTESNNSAIYTLTNEFGCDSVIMLDLTINEIDVSTSTSDFTITANEYPATYQWLDCNDDYSEIIGETTQSYTPIEDGTYAVSITKDGCIDTSECVTIVGLALDEQPQNNGLVIYPNPNQGHLFINSPNSDEINVKITDMDGKLCFQQRFLNTTIIEIDLNVVPGTYVVEVNNDGEISHHLLFIN